MPQVGGGGADVARASLDALRLASAALNSFSPGTVVLISPRAPGLADAFVVDDSEVFEGTLAQFGDPTIYRYKGDPALGSALLGALEGAGVPAVSRKDMPRLEAGWLDHASIVPLAFLDPEARCPLVVLSLSYLSYAKHRRMGEIVRSVADDLGRRVAFVASADMSHRLTRDAPAGYSPRGAQLDARILELVEQGRLRELMELPPDLVEAGGECGLRSVIVLGGYCREEPVPTRVLAYEGPWGVGYLTALVGRAALDAMASVSSERAEAMGAKGGLPGFDESEIVGLARRAIAAHVGEDEPLHETVLSDPALPKKAGAFVSLHRGGLLRGCIGTILPVHDTLAQEVAHNAVEAATRDPRFPPLEPFELADLDIKVDVLQPPETCSLDELDPSQYGVIVSSGWRRGLLLPDLEGIDDVETQVRIAMQKAGIGPDDACAYERFRVDRYT
jgi:AmmeMemoRadiSam system protein A